MTPSPCFDPRFVLLAATALALAATLSPAVDTVPTSSSAPAGVQANNVQADGTNPDNPLATASPPDGPAPGQPLAVQPTQPTAWRSPLDGQLTVTRQFDPPATTYGPGHRGVDLSAPPGSPVRAAGAGLVTYAGPVAGRGVVVVSHGSLRTTYEPVTAAVTAGTHVAAGELLGHLEPAHPGCPTAGCLHWGLLQDDTYLDPLALLTPPRPHLLPLG